MKSPNSPLMYARRRRANKKWLWVAVAAITCLIVLCGWWAFARSPASPSANTPPGTLAWPSFGQAAVGIVGTSTIQTYGDQTPVPTASTAKMITALVVLQAKPLSPGQTGPMLTMSRDDLVLLKTYAALDGSRITKMGVGEQLSEYQMLEAMMLPSADNAADSLAIWAYGSLPAYSAAANSYLAGLGLSGTHVGTDASGLDPSTVSTAHDMVLIGELVMQNPVLAEIVGEQSVSGFPLVGTITNTNSLLGQDGIVGVKTGNSDEQSGAYVAAADATVNGKTETIVTAVLDAPSLDDAMDASVPLIKSTRFGSLSKSRPKATQDVSL